MLLTWKVHIKLLDRIMGNQTFYVLCRYMSPLTHVSLKFFHKQNHSIVILYNFTPCFTFNFLTPHQKKKNKKTKFILQNRDELNNCPNNQIKQLLNILKLNN